ncbi:MAG: XRE family transcriptional regulator [Solirubrobacteraceae bacterium]
MLELDALGVRVRELRVAQGLGLQALSSITGVSVSMLSAIERAEKAPTVVVLSRIADGLKVTLGGLLAPLESDRVVLRRAAEHEIIDEPGGWRRVVLSPVIPGVNFEWIRTRLPAHCDAGAFPAYAPGSHEFVSVETGTLHATIAEEVYELLAGDTLYFPSGTHAYANHGDAPCTYAVAALIMRPRTASTPRD